MYELYVRHELTLTFSIVEPHRHAGVFVARGKEDLLVTKNLTPGESVYGEKRISVGAAAAKDGEEAPSSTEYRVWNPFRSKLAAGILGGGTLLLPYTHIFSKLTAKSRQHLHGSRQQGALSRSS